MTDIQSSLRRLQESIRGLSDASALVGATSASVASSGGSVGRDIFENRDETSCCENDDDRGHSSGDLRGRPGARSRSSTLTFKDTNNNQRIGGRGGNGSGAGSPKLSQLQRQQQSFLSSLGAGDLRDSAEGRAARELEDLRLEKESLQLMKQQLAAVHQLRTDLQRKDSVIQSLQVKVQEGQSVRDRADRLETHCHLLEERCSYLESTNGDYAERLGALDQETRSRNEGLMRELDDLGRRLRGAETELEAEKRRAAAESFAHRRELSAALAEGVEARCLTEDLKASLKEASAQAKRRHKRSSEMEELLTAQIEETRAGLVRADRRATAASDARRRDAEAATAASTALAKHVEAVVGRGEGGTPRGVGGGGGGGGRSGGQRG